jgi:hypothetical protein
MQQGPYTPPPPAYGDNQIRPALWWFFVAGGLAVVGIVGGIALLVSGVVRWSNTVEDFDRVSVPGTGEVQIDETGGYSIYHEYERDTSFRFYPPDPDVTVTDPSGEEVVLDWYSGSVTYAVSGYEGEGLFTFDAEETGTYTVTTEGDSESVVAVGRGVGRGLAAPIVAGVAVGFIGVVGGIVMAIVVGVKRSGHRRRLRAIWNPPPGPPPGAWGPAPGAPGWGPQPPPGQPVPPPPPPPGPSSGTF